MALTETPDKASDVHNTPWQQRLKALGLTQKRFAALAGLAENTVSRQMRDEWPMPDYVKALIVALEIIGPERLPEWIAAVEAPRPPTQTPGS